MMTIMMAKCFAKGCHQKASIKEANDVKNWRSCMGCRSHWIHVTCGGFCSECQPNNESKMKVKRSTDRSPLSIRQSMIAKRLEDSVGFKEGKENSSGVSGKRHRKPVTPPSLTPVGSVPNDNNNKEAANAGVDKKVNNEEHVGTINRKRKLSASNATTPKLEPAAKKAKQSSISTAPGGTPKKYASEPHAKLPRVKKVIVEVKEDGTHNPDRLIFHVKNNQPIDHGEPEAEESYDWLINLSRRQIDEFVDLNEGEKSFFKLWNAHLHQFPCYGDLMLLQILEMFIDSHAIKIHRSNLYKNFILHLSNLHSFSAITSSSMMSMISRYQEIIRDMVENPDKYPLTPIKEPIENPYYVPPPVPLESLMQQQRLSEEQRAAKSSSMLTSAAAAATKSGRSFWLKKCFRNPASKSDNDQDHDLDRWPRKKAVVTFANEVFVDEIRDLHDKPGNNGLIAGHDITDLYKFISPRQRRGKS